jgi:TrkA domain protein
MAVMAKSSSPREPRPVRESTLPGIGKKYTLGLSEGGNLAVVVKPDGERQLYHFRSSEDRPCDVITLDEGEARQVGSLMGAALATAPDTERLALALGELEIEWLTLEDDSPFVGKTLAQSELRKATGASVVAVIRNDRALPNPSPDTVFSAGDTLLIIGSHAQCDAARDRIGTD